ncbi:hypothetical protein NKR23_g12317 [Pleurostoma richardsiae]|uniref:DUF7587 domain-containing protein n=1 Tax=Pleurostoma richardsiae TaxID=41990 RepID=A0AA38VIP8_9PEZI|nr:hypothetical protein NKR23_g12317 [Pleurostoma richardsiae]
MATRTMYTRAYSKSSAGRLVSGRGLGSYSLSRAQLLDDFQKHADRIEEPTALVSVSDRLVDTVKRAYDKHSENDSPADIWVAFIEVPATAASPRLHAAQDLAEDCGRPDSGLFRHEFVFEWAIPEEYVLHTVSLQTLMDRGLEWEQHFAEKPLSTASLLDVIAWDLLSAERGYDPWDIGVRLGYFARTFGARAPVDWIAHQLFYDCARPKIVYEDVVRLYYDYDTVDFVFFCELDHGIEAALFDWWLADVDLCRAYEEFMEWQAGVEDRMTWDFIDLWEHYGVSDCESVRELSVSERSLYEKSLDALSARHRREIEAEAVKLGL